MNMIQQINEGANDVNKIVAHWKAEGADLTDAELKSEVGNDLEQLEYTPEQIEKLVPTILGKIKAK